MIPYDNNDVGDLRGGPAHPVGDLGVRALADMTRIRRLVSNYYASMKFYLVPEDLNDESWLREFAQMYMRPEALANHYAFGSIDLPELELLLDWHFGLASPQRP